MYHQLQVFGVLMAISALIAIVGFVAFEVSTSRERQSYWFGVFVIGGAAALIFLMCAAIANPKRVKNTEVARLSKGWSITMDDPAQYVPDSHVIPAKVHTGKYEFWWSPGLGHANAWVTEKEGVIPDLRYGRIVDQKGNTAVVRDGDDYTVVKIAKSEKIQTIMDSVFMTGPRTWIRLPQSVWTWEGKDIEKGHLIEWVAN